MLDLPSRSSGHTTSRMTTSPELATSRQNPLGIASSTVPIALRPSTRANKAAQPSELPETLAGKQKLPLETRKRTRDGRPASQKSVEPDGINGTINPAATVEVIQLKNGTGSNGTVKRRVDAFLGAENLHKSKVRIVGDESPRQKTGEETRSLRSKAGGSRLKSDLAIYFANFEDVIAGTPQPKEYLSLDEAILITDAALPPSQGKAALPRVSTISKPTTTGSFDKVDLFSLAPVPISTLTTDPLNDEIFFPTHRRAERREKQLRNIEKERAQHEKGQLEILLDSLQGPDWLRVMGITGITDGARKDYEPKRDYFIREVRGLLKKFQVWKEAEKRLQLEKAAREEDYEEESSVEPGTYNDSDGDSHDINSSDIDAWAARQLQQEAKIASKSRPRPSRPKAQVPPKPPEPPKPFTSFYAKPHLRAAALSKGRAGRRTVLALGHPLPDMPEVEFGLPDYLLTPEALLANARKRRRRNREKKDDEKT
ncbi:hypothetical protein BT63DRAFT_7119 [Microthyrium microscopicum]|uniref:Something about silencing protein 4 domain-containing protein n=1 Tax=Microthyrium microscopicum TaxID=703497 RepID=A0A6A6URB3_9PEZI|nr:hypothetical protein BT63DRAFT_7119 [Microthyrium microscopicum]